MKLVARDSVLDLSYPIVMGILNITPDSFFDGGAYNSITSAINYTDLMIKSGAAIIDIGGESTRPGAVEISVEEELSRVIPILEAILKRFSVWVSVNTSRPEVIRESAKAGVHIINDVRSLMLPGARKAAAETSLPICLVHMHGKPSTMQNSPKYGDVFSDVKKFFIDNIKLCELAGIAKEKLLLDPGFGFGKNFVHNYTLLARLSEFHKLGLPLLVGVSRKSMLGNLFNSGPEKLLNASLGCATIAAIQGAHIIRAHDVKETVEVMSVVKATLSARKRKHYE